MNELLLLYILLIMIVSFIIFTKKYNNNIMNIYLLFIILISYILSFRNISLIGMNINSNIILYSAIIPMLYYYIEKNKGIKIKDLLLKIIIFLIISLLFIMLTVGYIPSVTDNNAINIQNLFGINYIKLLSYPITLLLTVYILFKLKEKLKNVYPNHLYSLFILGSITTAIDIIVYNVTAYSLTEKTINIIYMMTISYIIRIIILLMYSVIIEKNLLKKKVKK